MIALYRDVDPFGLDRERGRCLICGAPGCSCRTWLKAAMRPASVPPEPAPAPSSPGTFTQATYDRKTDARRRPTPTRPARSTTGGQR